MKGFHHLIREKPSSLFMGRPKGRRRNADSPGTLQCSCLLNKSCKCPQFRRNTFSSWRVEPRRPKRPNHLAFILRTFCT